ncbi:helix-turn-helix transcriptional regulator [Streptomyces sp. 7-21]|uniref:helix-turn-helix domain-containing protein n=1 Tax=Streptomyces sp. 7-21 TaxID=2802283 RepID=UPI00191EA397|nr:helix-turn-helix transcriptional regulator [Streptomyces sp. 7-21]MBL1065710.1 helix-turn-helix domain-containing protein [Streptomyces sp. 7-21]
MGETRRRPAAPEVEHLLARLREVKERSGLSYAALGARTRCSKSSWQRYLCGRTLPPREAVEDLARLGGEAPERLVALWELAERAWRRRDDAGDAGDAGHAPAAAPPAGNRGHTATARVALACLATAVAVLAGVLVLWRPAGTGPPAAPPAPAATATGRCAGASCTGRDSDSAGTACWADAGTRARLTAGGRTVELRASAACQAAWARLTEPRSGDQVWIEAGDERQAMRATARNRYMHTLMIGFERPARARACVTLADGTSVCTHWASVGPEQPDL